MAGWIGSILSGGAGELIKQVGDVADKFNLSGEEKQEFKLQMETLLQKRDAQTEETLRTELGAKERVMVAELQQSDGYTKRARPTLVYSGLVFIAWNYCLVPSILSIAAAFGADVAVAPFVLPGEFWASWGGVCGTWVIGRSVEKRGYSNMASRAITGSKKLSSMLDD